MPLEKTQNEERKGMELFGQCRSGGDDSNAQRGENEESRLHSAKKMISQILQRKKEEMQDIFCSLEEDCFILRS